ncbi:MAG: PBP1A family penicillin-binding protein [Turneriella sp.]|nr:PBP1A family penicillin-binding protein [Turneriella sp.]
MNGAELNPPLRGLPWWQKVEKIAVYSFFLSAFFGGMILGFIHFRIHSKTGDLDRLASFRPTIPTRLYDQKGRLIAELFRHQRKLVSLEEIPRPVIAAFLAIEDSNFYDHFGIDFKGIARATFKNLRARRVVAGGSTITQQLVKGLYTESERTLYRKVYEAILALQVEKAFTKDEILEMYFNQTYFGHGAYGISAAAQFYFDKPVSKLNFMEASILAALPKSPHNYSPFRAPHEAYKKNKASLNRLVEVGYITKQEADTLYKTFWPVYWKKIVTTPPSKTIFGEKVNNAPYFTEHVRQELITLYGEDAVYSKGLQVYTTLDLEQQKAAEKVLLPALTKLDPVARAQNSRTSSGIQKQKVLDPATGKIVEKAFSTREYSLRGEFRSDFKEEAADALQLVSLTLPATSVNEVSTDFMSSSREHRGDLHVQGALLALDLKTGRYSAMIGGREYKSSDQFNRATMARRQPGSAMKVFVYGAALESRGIHYAMGFIDSPLVNVTPTGKVWAPSNFDSGFSGYVLAFRALSASINLISVQVYDLVGPDVIINYASRLMKVPESRFQPNPSLALGTSEVTPAELLLGYAIIGNKGQDIIPHAIMYIADREGNVIAHPENDVIQALNYKRRTGQIQIIEEGSTFILRKMMENVVNAGTPTQGIRVDGGYKGPGAGKTGTTNSFNDVWFSGFSTETAAVVWFGMDNGDMTLGKGITGGAHVAPVWGGFMAEIDKIRGREAPPFDQTMPASVKTGAVCKFTGKWINPKCDTSDNLTGTLIPQPITKNGKRLGVGGEACDCHHAESKSFLDLLQADHNVQDEEVGRKNKYKKSYDMIEGDKLRELGGDLPVPVEPAPSATPGAATPGAATPGATTPGTPAAAAVPPKPR